MPRRPRHPAPAARAAIVRAVIEALEPRRLLAGIAGDPTAEVGEDYPLQLVYGNPNSAWDLDWGDGVAETVSGGNYLLPTHRYAAGTYTPVATFEGRAHPLALDPDFGQFGRVIMDLGSWEKVKNVALESDASGRLIAAGDSNGDFALVRFLPSGAPDPSFGSGGKVFTDFGATDRAEGIALQPDGKIVVVGYGGPTGNFAAARYLPDGSLDPSFGVGGKVTTDFNAYDWAREVRLQPDGKIVVAGQAGGSWGLARYLPNGSPDASFGNGGKLFTTMDNGVGTAMELLPDGKLLVVGTAGGNQPGGAVVGIARYLPNGALDQTFGTGGRRTHDLSSGPDVPTDVAVLPDGKFVVTRQDAAGGLAVSRFTPAGALDTTFGSGGTAQVAAGLGGLAHTVLVDPDGSLTVGGETETFPSFARFRPDGTPDPTFGIGGFFQDEWGTGTNAYGASYSLARRPDGKIVSGGTLWGQFALHQLLPDNRLVVAARPEAPTDLAVTQVTPDTVTLQWFDNAIDETGYEIWASEAGADFVKLGTTSFYPGTGASAFQLPGLYPDSTYRFEVRASGADAASAFSGPVAATTPTLAIAGADTAAGGTPYTLSLNTSFAAGEWNHWQIDWGDGTDRQTLPSGSPATATHTFAPGVTSPVVSASAVDNDGFDHVADPLGVSVTGVAAPAAPVNLIATPFSDSRIDLAWTQPTPDAVQSVVSRSDDAGQTWRDVGTLARGATTFSDAGLIAPPNGTPAASARLYRVVASNGAGPSPAAQAAPVAAATDAPAVTVAAVPSSRAGYASVEVSWVYAGKVQSAADGFQVEIRRDGQENFHLSSSGRYPGYNPQTKQFTAHIDNLPTDAAHSFRVRALLADGTRTKYGAAQLTTAPAAPYVYGRFLTRDTLRVEVADNSSTETDFVIDRSVNNGPWTPAGVATAASPGARPTLEVGGLPMNASVTLRARARRRDATGDVYSAPNETYLSTARATGTLGAAPSATIGNPTNYNYPAPTVFGIGAYGWTGNVDGYEYELTGNGVTKRGTYLGGSDTALENFSDLPSAGTVTGRIRAYNAAGFSPWVAGTAKTAHAFTRLSAPSVTAAAGSAPGEVNIAWAAPARTQVPNDSGGTSPILYRVAYAPAAQSFNADPTSTWTDAFTGYTAAPAADGHLTITGLTPGVLYRFAAAAVSSTPYVDYILASGASAFVTALAAPAAVPVTKPAAVTGLHADISFGDAPYYDDPSKNKVKLTWDNVPNNEEGFKIYRTEVTGFRVVKTKDSKGIVTSTNVPTLRITLAGSVGADVTTWTDEGMLPGNYDYELIAYNAAGDSAGLSMTAGVWAPGVLVALDGTLDYLNNPIRGGDFGNQTVIAKFSELYNAPKRANDYHVGTGIFGDNPDIVRMAVFGATGLDAPTKIKNAVERLVEFYRNPSHLNIPLDIVGYSRGAFSAVQLAALVSQGLEDKQQFLRFENKPVQTGTNAHGVMSRVPVYKRIQIPMRFLGLISPVAQFGLDAFPNFITAGGINLHIGWPTKVPSAVRHVVQLLDNQPNHRIFPQTKMAVDPATDYFDSPADLPNENFFDHGLFDGGHPSIGVNKAVGRVFSDRARIVNVPVDRIIPDPPPPHPE